MHGASLGDVHIWVLPAAWCVHASNALLQLQYKKVDILYCLLKFKIQIAYIEMVEIRRTIHFNLFIQLPFPLGCIDAMTDYQLEIASGHAEYAE